jgi:hypothetical protein
MDVQQPEILRPKKVRKLSKKITKGRRTNKSAKVATRKVKSVTRRALYDRPRTMLMQMAKARLITMIIVTTLFIALCFCFI